MSDINIHLLEICSQPFHCGHVAISAVPNLYHAVFCRHRKIPRWAVLGATSKCNASAPIEVIPFLGIKRTERSMRFCVQPLLQDTTSLRYILRAIAAYEAVVVTEMTNILSPESGSFPMN